MKKFNLFLFFPLFLPVFNGISLQGAEVKAAVAAEIVKESERSGVRYLRKVLADLKLPEALFNYYRSKEVPASLQNRIDEVLATIDFSKENWDACENDHVEITKTLSGKVFTLKQIPSYIFKGFSGTENFVLGRILRAELLALMIAKHSLRNIGVPPKMVYFSPDKNVPYGFELLVVEPEVKPRRHNKVFFMQDLQVLRKVAPGLTIDIADDEASDRNHISGTIIDTEDFYNILQKDFDLYAKEYPELLKPPANHSKG